MPQFPVASRRQRGPAFAAIAGALLMTACDPGYELPSWKSGDLSCEVAASLPDGGIPAVDTSMTPRENASAEVLALEASGEFIAPDGLYERVAGDLDALQGRWPDEAHGGAAPCGPPGLFVAFTDAGIEQVESGQYHAWDGYNAVLRLAEIQSFPSALPKVRFLRFDGLYNALTLQQAYAELPEVEWVEPNGWAGGGSIGPADACLERLGDAEDTHLYIFRRCISENGDGCTGSTFDGFATDRSGRTSHLGRVPGPGVGWFVNAQQCRRFLDAT